MSGTAYFTRPCPACARMVQINVRYLGREVGCSHCGRKFIAVDQHSQSAAMEDPIGYWLNFTEQAKDSIENALSGNTNRHPR